MKFLEKAVLSLHFHGGKGLQNLMFRLEYHKITNGEYVMQKVYPLKLQ